MGEHGELAPSDFYVSAHLKMEQALAMLDAAGEGNASIHLDRAIVELGLREPAVGRRMVKRMSSSLTFSPDDIASRRIVNDAHGDNPFRFRS